MTAPLTTAGTTEQTDLCRLEVEGSMATVTLNRPEARNALNIELLDALIARLEECLVAGITVLVLRAEGTAFCAGADLRSDDGTAIGKPSLRRDLIERSIDLVGSFPASISAVQGPAVGGGWGLAFAADVVVAAEGALFKFPELALSFLPPTSILRRFVEVAGPVRSLRLLGSGEPFRAEDVALEGLVEAVPPALLGVRTRELAQHFSRSAPGLLQVLKRDLNASSVRERQFDE